MSKRTGLPRSEYASYIRSKKWAATKARYRKSKLPQLCVVCGSTKWDLHHRSYNRLGCERLSDLVPLCRLHHDDLHQFHSDSGSRDLWRSSKKYVRSVSKGRHSR